MWYFSWVLGLGLACTFSILNAMWLELLENSVQSNNDLTHDDLENKPK